jgi:hypothetical protein
LSADAAPDLPTEEEVVLWAHSGIRAILIEQKRSGTGPIDERHVHFASMLTFLPTDAIQATVLKNGILFLAREYQEEIEKLNGRFDSPFAIPSAWFNPREVPAARLWAVPSPESPLGVRAWVVLRRHHDIKPIGGLARMAELCGFGSAWSGYRFFLDCPASWVVFQILMHEGLCRTLNSAEQACAKRLLDHIRERSDQLPIDLQRDGKMLLESQVIHWPGLDPEWGLQWLWYVPYESHQHEVIKKLGCIWSKDHGGWAVRAGDDPLEVAERMLKVCNRRAIFLLPDARRDLARLSPHFPGPVSEDRLSRLKFAYEALARCRFSLPGVIATGEIQMDSGAPEAIVDVPYALKDVREQLGKFPGSRFCSERKSWVLGISRLNVGTLPKLRGITWKTDPAESLQGLSLPAFGTMTLFEDGCVEMSTPYHEGLVGYIRRHVDPLDKGWDGEQRVWRFRMAEPQVPARLATAVEQFELDVILPDGTRHGGQAAVSVMKQVGEQLVARYEESYQADSDYVAPGLKLEPFSFQRAGMAYVHRNGSCLIGDDCGLGKTVQAIGALLDHGEFPVFIGCPAIARLTWRMEWAKFTDEVAPEEILIVGVDEKSESSLEKMMQNKKVVICGYDGLKRYHEILKAHPFKAAVLDESHYIKNPNSLRGRLSREILKHGEMSLKLLLSATPYTDRPSELINQLDTIDRLEVMGGAEYIKKLDGLNDACREEELARFNRRLRSTCMIRRIKAEVMEDMPAVLVQMVPCEATGNYMQAEVAYAKMMLDSVLETLDGKAFAALHGLAADGRAEDLVEKLIGEHLVKARQATLSLHIAEIARLRHELGTEKIRSVGLWIRNFLSSTATTEKLVVFAKHIDVQNTLHDICRDTGIETVAITGSMSPEQRKASEIAFQEGTARCCVASLGAARENITLTAANHVLFAEQDYSGGAMIQARDRLIRIGQKAATVNVYFAIMANSLDGNMSRSITSKMEVITQGLGDGHEQAGLSQESTLGSLADIFRRHPGRVARHVKDYELEGLSIGAVAG